MPTTTKRRGRSQTRTAKSVLGNLKKTNKGPKEPDQERPSTASTSSTPTSNGQQQVAVVEDVEDRLTHCWNMNDGVYKNSRALGRLLNSLPTQQLYRSAEGDGLIQVVHGKVRRIATANDLGTLLMDHVKLVVLKNGKYHGERVDQTTLTNMLRANVFLSIFRCVKDVVTTPVFLSDDTPAKPGFNALDSILYLGSATSSATGMDAINKFIDVIEWQSNADRTNAIAAFLTVPRRLHWPGGKPFVLVTANKSHSGKTTVCEFINIDQTATARIEYDPLKDWPMQNQLYAQVMAKPEIGIISFDNVRTRSATSISSGYVESFVTSPEVVIGKATSSKAVWAANKFLVMLNSNEGSLSIDLLNRSLPIRLAPTGDVTQRRSPIGNPKLEYLPANRTQIIAERQGMVERWLRAGTPLDDSVAHYPMGPWAKVIGGILQVNGFKDFLANYSTTRAVADPIREAISILAFHNAGSFKRAGDLARSAVREGLSKILLPGVDSANEGAAERTLGHLFKKYAEETFAVFTTTDTGWEKITYRLIKKQGRFGEAYPHHRYTFEEVGQRETVTKEPQGLVLERPGIVGLPEGYNNASLDSDLDQYQPRTELP